MSSLAPLFAELIVFHLQERSKILLRFADLIEQHNDELATLETLDSGKPYEQARTIEVPSVTRLFRYYAGTSFIFSLALRIMIISLHLYRQRQLIHICSR